MASVKPVDFVQAPQPDTSYASTGGVRSTAARYSVMTSLERRKNTPLLRLRRLLAPLLDTRLFRFSMTASLFFALFGGSLWQVIDIPDQPGNVVLDVLMCFVAGLFFLEVVLNVIVNYREYPLSFFCLTDLLGTVSMIFEISFILGPAGKIQNGATSVNIVLMRTARAAKVGARVGRLSKMMKCLSVAYGGRAKSSKEEATAEAKVLSQRLMLALSTKVSMLTILLVLVVPLFDIGQYPEEDLSMREWTQRLEEVYRQSYDSVLRDGVGANGTFSFKRTVEKMELFYGDLSYKPFELTGFPETVVSPSGLNIAIPGAGFRAPIPVRKQNVYRQAVSQCLVARPECGNGRAAFADFNFRTPNQLEAGTDIAMIIFVVLVMAVVSFNLSQMLDSMVVQPLERMLGTMKTMAAGLLQQFGVNDEQEEGGEDRELVEETELIESIFRKLARLASLATQNDVATDEELAKMDDEGKGVLLDLMNMRSVQVAAPRERKPSSASSNHSVHSAASGTNQYSVELGGSKLVVQALPVSKQVLDSWDLDLLGLDPEGQKAVVLYIFFDTPIGGGAGRLWTRLDTFQRFQAIVSGGYHDLPYHNYTHACDVLHALYRVLSVTAADRWMSPINQYAMLVAALCHDLGHMGRTNPFLVETKHELALCYNDKSPLENMHCSKLFQICSMEGCNVFERADNEEQKQARRTCISAILHTDNALHFEMVKEISKIYEVLSEVCEAQAAHPTELSPSYQELVLDKNMGTWFQLFLHFVDVSNPLKPFKICQLWAWRVLDEFFAQGDEEKRLGLPIGMLNDREKINRPGSQHGFINFLVAPLVTTTVRLFPPLHPLVTQMARNVESWRDLWVEDAKPSPEDIAKRDVDVKKLKDVAAELSHRSS